MKKSRSALRWVFQRMGLGLVVMVCGLGTAAQAQDRSEKLKRFEADRKACLSGKTNQVLDSCLKEAKSFLTERAGSNPTVSAEQLQRNALLRCDALTGDERTACAARIRGEGSVSGSVSGGGILRELITTDVVSPDTKNPAPAGTGK